MKSLTVLCCVGLAASSVSAQAFTPTDTTAAQTLRPISVQPILGVSVGGDLELGDTVTIGGAADGLARGSDFTRVVYDSLWTSNTDGDTAGALVCGDVCAGLPMPQDRWLLGDHAMLAVVDDIELGNSTTSQYRRFDGFRMYTNFPAACPSQPLEPLAVVLTIYDSGPLGFFDTNGDGQGDNPYPRTDTDGDGLLDQFTGGVIVSFANVDTDGDTSNGFDALDVSGGGLFFLDAASLTDTNSDGIPGDTDFGGFPSGDFDGDDDPNGAVEIFFTRGFGDDTNGDGDPDGPIFGVLEPSRLSPSMLWWGTPDADTSGCAASFGVTEGSSGGVAWVQFEDACTIDPDVGSSSWDDQTDLADYTSVVSCPDPLTPALQIFGATPPLSCATCLCADSNLDGSITPADFNAWIINYNTQNVARCDNNNDGLCTPADFNAWIINYNLGAGGPTCP